MLSRRRLCTGTALALAFDAAHGLETLRVAAVEDDWETEAGLKVLEEIYARTGLGLLVQRLPASRATLVLKNGEVDAEVMRTPSYGLGHPESLRVPTPFYAITLHAYSLARRNLQIRSLDDMASYSVGLTRGLSSAREFLSGKPSIPLTLANNHALLYRMLLGGRIDLVVETRIRMLQMLYAFRDTSVATSSELATFNLHHYVHRRYPELVARIDRTTKSMGNARLKALAERGLAEVLRHHRGQPDQG